MQTGEKSPKEHSSSLSSSQTTSPVSAGHVCQSASNNSDSKAPLANCEAAQHTPCSTPHANRINRSLDSATMEKQLASEKAMRQAVIIVEEEPALVHTRHVAHRSATAPEHPGAVYAWSPATPDLAELIPIGTTQSQRESATTYEAEVSPCSLFASGNGSPRAAAVSSPSRVSTMPGESAQNAAIAGNTLSLQSNAILDSPGTESVQDTPSSSVTSQHRIHATEASDEAVTPLLETRDAVPATPLNTSTPLSPPSLQFCRRLTVAPTRLCAPTPQLRPARSSSPSVEQCNVGQQASMLVASAPGKSASIDLRVRVGSSPPSSAPLCLHMATEGKTNATGGTVPNVPAIRLPVAPVSPGMESDRSVSVMGYGPRSAPNACSLVSARSARSGRSSRSARHSHRCCGSMRASLPSLKELFPTLPAEMYLARERLCVAHDGSGCLGVGAYGTVQRAELYPPEVEAPHFFSPVAETWTNASNPNTPGHSPTTAQLSSHNFTSASTVGAADGGVVAVSAGTLDREHSNVFLNSHRGSLLSMDSVSTLPLHQQPYNDHTASFYNGLDEAPGLMCAESLNDSRWPARDQSPEVESVVLCGSLAVHTDSEEASALATLSTKGRLDAPRSPATSLSVERREHQTATPPTSVTSCCVSQKFPDLPGVLASKIKDGDLSGFSLTSQHAFGAKLLGEELDLDAEDNTTRMSAGKSEVKGMLTGPLRDSEVSDQVELSLTSTSGGTDRYASPGSPRSNNKTCCHNSRIAGSTAHDGRDEAGKNYSDRRADNFTALSAQVLFGSDGTPLAIGDEGRSSFSKAALRRTTKLQAAGMPVSAGKDDGGATPLPHTVTAEAAQKDGRDVHEEAAVCLPLVLSRGRPTNTSSTSGRSAGSSPNGSAHRGANAADVAEDAEEQAKTVEAGGKDVDTAAKKRFGASVKDRASNCHDRRTCSISFADGQEVSFLAGMTVAHPQDSPAQVGDDTLTSATQTAHMAREEFKDPCNLFINDSRRPSADTEGQHGNGRNEICAVDGVTHKTAPPAPLSSKTPMSTSATTPGHLPTTSCCSNYTAGNDGKRVEQISPTSTISSLFSGGVTNLTTTRTPKQGSVGVMAQVSENPLQFPRSNAPLTPLVRYGVNSAMISDAVSNGCTPFRPVATKVVEKSDLVDNAMKLNAFHNELRMASRLNHPCLVNVFGVAEDAEHFYLVMDMAEKGNLTQYQKEFGVKDTRAMAPRFLADLVLALEYLRDGSQHTYWMTPSEAAKPGHSMSSGNHSEIEKEGIRRCEVDSCPASTSTLSLRPIADASSSTTPKLSALLSMSGASLQRQAEGTSGGASDKAAASTAEKEPQKQGDALVCTDGAAQSEANKVLMTESIVLHRDVKPDNLLLTWDFHVKLADFGDACFYGDEEANSFGGTPSYISPEVIQTSKAGPCSDLWAMGCILYELLVGEKLFTGSLREVADSIQAFIPEELVFPAVSAKASADANQDVHCEEDDDTARDGSGDGNRDDCPGGTISEAAKDLVRQLLRHVPEERIGSAERGGFLILKRHPFFGEIDWATVLETTNITTINTDYTSELADYLELGECVVYCSPVKVLPTGEAHARAKSTHLAAQGSLVMVLTDTPRLFLVNPDTDSIQFWLPWSPELRVGVLCADRFSITVPINDVLVSPSTPGFAFNGGTSMGAISKTGACTASTITYTFYDTTRRADLWGVKIHYLLTVCPPRRDGVTPTFSSRQSSTTPPTSTNGVPPLHWPPPSSSTRRGTPTLSPRAGGCLLHRLRTTPRSARAGSISSHAMSFNDTTVATPRDGRSTMAASAGSFAEMSACSAVSTTAVSTTATSTGVPVTATKAKPITRYSQSVWLPATSFLASSAPASTLFVAANGRPVSTAALTSPAGVSSGVSSTGLRSPELFPASHATPSATVTPTHHRVNAMTVTIASSSQPPPPPQPPHRRARPASLGNTTKEADTGASSLDVGATMTVGLTRTAVTAVAEPSAGASASQGVTPRGNKAVTLTDSVNGDSLCEEMLGFSTSVGDATPRAARTSDGGGDTQVAARDTPTQSEATPGPSSGQRHPDLEPEMECSCGAHISSRCESSSGHDTDTPAKASCAAGSTATTAPKETLSKVRQQYKKTQRRKFRA